MEVRIPLEICREGVSAPAYARRGDAGMDVRAAVDLVLEPGQTAVVPTGLKFAIPEGYELQVRPRSGLSLHTKLRIPNAPGTIDAGYRDELGVLMENTSPPGCVPPDAEPLLLDAKGGTPGRYRIRKGDRIAQLVLSEAPRAAFERVGRVDGIGQDRGGGFGSTGP